MELREKKQTENKVIFSLKFAHELTRPSATQSELMLAIGYLRDALNDMENLVKELKNYGD